MADQLYYWRNEVSGRLQLYIYTLLNGGNLTELAIRGLKTYFSHWADYPGWFVAPSQLGTLATVRSTIREARTKEDLLNWLDLAEKIGIDPL